MGKTGIHPERRRRRSTNLVRGGLMRSQFGETSEALFLCSGFVYDNAAEAEARFKGEAEGYVYSRYGNPTVAMFEERMALLEGAEACFATASGMAAVFAALMCQLKAGDHVVSSRSLFGSCYYIVSELLPRYGIETTLVDGPDLDQWRAALATGAKSGKNPRNTVVFFETPSNPMLEIIDLAAVIGLAHEAGASVVVDNVFSTPLLQRPIDYGADVVVYSGTKHIDGQGRTLGGAILSTAEFRHDTLLDFVRHTGPALSPFNAWVMLKGLETLDLRLEHMCRQAAHLAAVLEGHPLVTRVLYPELASHPQHALAMAQMTAGGSVVSFEVAGGKNTAFTVLDSVEVFDISNNLGDTKSLITHPATTTHRAMGEEARARIGVTDGLIRISAGLEDIDDLTEDLLLALDTAAKRQAA